MENVITTNVITTNVAINSWLIYWITYWIVGGILSFKGHIDNVRKVTRLKDVCLILIINMMWSLIGTLIITWIPLRAMTNWNILIKFTMAYLVTDIWFYHTHIMMHQPRLYKLFHKMHHEFIEPYPLVALYGTPYEIVISSTFSGGLGMQIFQIGSPYIYIWFFIVSLNSICTHSGYRYSFLIDGVHDYHHYLPNWNYGSSPLFDKLYGTYHEPIK